MLALIPVFVLAAALGGDPVFQDAAQKVEQGQAAEAVPLFQSLLGKADLTDAERAELQAWLTSCYMATGDSMRARGHAIRAVELDPAVQAPPGSSPAARALLEAVRPAPPMPWIESPAGIATFTGAGIAGLAVALAGLAALDYAVTGVWLDGWYDSLATSGEVAAPRAYADFVVKQNKRYARVREGRRADLAVIATAATLAGAGAALAVAGLLTPTGDVE